MTTDITELAQSLKAAAEKASGNVWTSDGCGGVCSELGTNNGFYVAECDGSDWEENSRFIVLANPANILALVEALEKAQQERYEFRNRLKLERSILEDADKRIAELESEVKFPGVMRCNACGFSRTHIIATPDGMRAGKSEPENCPNGCGPMWHDTYRRQYDELYDAYTALRESHAQVIQSRDHYKRMSEEGLKQLAEPRTVTVENLQESAYRAGLTAGWNLGLTNNNDGFNKCLAAHAAGIKWEAENAPSL
ncbi:TPA: ead/Ea22-like family protein [Klebsiella aerogenes]|nr:ead/Ea22-like family protein [Klebsiella aerogenes]